MVMYLFEFKRDNMAEPALKQIDTREYVLSFVAESRELIIIGASFESATRKLADW